MRESVCETDKCAEGGDECCLSTQSQHKRILIWGTGNTARNVINKGIAGDIVGFIATTPDINVFENRPVYAPEEIRTAYDFIYVASTYSNEIYKTVQLLNFPLEKVCFMRLPDALKLDALSNYEKAVQFLEPQNLAYLSKENRATSITDNGAYPAFCLAASLDEDIFAGFRKDPVYCEVLEHVTPQFGQKYLDIISSNRHVIFTNTDWDSFCQNDLYGGPELFPYNINGKTLMLSPSTLRYIKVMQDILMIFETNKVKSVAEIGVGYAGQCRLLTDWLKALHIYYLIDLPEVLSLAKQYLSHYNSIGKVQFIDGTSNFTSKEDYDLVISNYAFSELKRDVQDIYLAKIISRASAGYITWNALSCEYLDGYSVDELLKKIPGAKVIEETPISDTYKKNCIIIWGQKNS